MKSMIKPSIRPTLCGLVLALAVTALSSSVGRATPYASMVTNINYAARTMQFWLNEGGGTVTVTFSDSTTAPAPLNGSTAVASGVYTFNVPAGATSYTISCFKVGAGSPTLVQTSLAFTPRGVDVNKNVTSPYFGRVYTSISGGTGINAFNPDMTLAFTGAASPGGGCVWFGGGFSPYRLFVAADDYLMVGDATKDFSSHPTGALQNEGVWRLDPNLGTAQLFLGPRGADNGTAGIGSGPIHSTIQSRPVVIGNPSLNGGNNPVTLVTVDGDYTWANGYNSLLVYTNITLNTLPWQNVPDIQGPEVALNIAGQALGGNEYPGLQFFGNYIYAGTYRENYGFASIQVYTNDFGNGDTFAKVWDSITGIGGVVGTGPDLFRITVSGNIAGTVDLAVSPDGRFCVAQSILNWFVIAYLTNGIPDSSRVFNNIPTSFTGNARGIAFDAAGNIYSSSSGIGNVQEWSLGITTTANTAGNTNTSTGFSVTSPATEVSATATSKFASQGGNNGVAGTPVNGVFTITRSGATASTLPIKFTLSGTATSGVYTVSQAGVTVPTSPTVPTTNTVVIAAGQTSTNIIITPTTANVPRLQTTVVLTLQAGASYGTTLPFSDTVLIQNTSSNELVVSTSAATMYKAFSNDFASILLTRLGDTNVSYTIPAGAFSYSGTAVPNVDFTPMAAVTFNPGDFTKTATVSPLSNGVPPVDTINPLYVGNKSITVTVAGGATYGVAAAANSGTLTLLDNANPPSILLFADPLTNSADAANWNITFGSGDEANLPAAYQVDFGFDLTTANGDPGTYGTIGLPPSGETTALRITCDKNIGSGSMFGGGVNVYYTNKVFSGNYAVRFNMNLVEGNQGLYAVEGAMFGINHNGSESNWFLGSGALAPGSGPWASDGVWYWIQAPPGGSGGYGLSDFEEYTGASALPNTGWLNIANVNAMPNVFKRAVFTAPGGLTGGTPANNSPVSATPQDNNWSDVEIKQVNNVITMSIDKTPIFVYTNTTTFTNGYLMLGYNCPITGTFNQFIGTPDASVYFSNLRVVSLAQPVIAGIKVVGQNCPTTPGNAVITFTSNDPQDTTANFAIQSASVVNGPYTDVSPAASITQLAPQSFQATTPASCGTKFYRIRYAGVTGQ
jgi:hypothetical protein